MTVTATHRTTSHTTTSRTTARKPKAPAKPKPAAHPHQPAAASHARTSGPKPAHHAPAIAGAPVQPVAAGASPLAGMTSVYKPLSYVPQGYTTKYPDGVFLGFKTPADAETFAGSQGGVVVQPDGKPASKQPWGYAAQFEPRVRNHELSATPPKGKVAVWYPAGMEYQVGIQQKPHRFTEGSYLAFDSEAEARKDVTARGVGVVLDKSGKPDATQPWYNAKAYIARMLNSQLTPALPTGKFSVWFPPSQLYNLGVTDTKPYAKGGAFLAFATEKEAADHATQRGWGVIIDDKGKPAAKQPTSAYLVPQFYNRQISPHRTPHKFAVWIPNNYLSSAGVQNTKGLSHGGYIAFDTEADAMAHAKSLNYGVVLDEKGALGTTQPWAQARSAALANKDIPKPPPSGWVTGPKATTATKEKELGKPTAGSIAIGKVTASKKGADVEVFVGNTTKGDQITFAVGAQINGNWTPIFNVPDPVALTGTGWKTFHLHLDYESIGKYLHTINGNLGVTANMQAAIGITFASGHNTGIPGWSSNSGTEKDAFLSLPAKA